MSAENNKPIIKKAKELLDNLGHNVSTSELYEVFSKLSDQPSWNVASAKKISFESILRKFKLATSSIKDLTGQQVWELLKTDILKKIESKEFEDQFVFGVLLNSDAKLLTANFSMMPNSLHVGSMGSGKSVGLEFSILFWLLTNHHHTKVHIIDIVKGAEGYAKILTLPQVTSTLSSIDRLADKRRVEDHIIFLYEELMKRQALFDQYGAEMLKDYEKKSGAKLERLVTVFEEFHGIPHDVLNFTRDYKTEGTPAHKFYTLMRVGRSYGIWIMAASQRATQSDIPAQISVNFVNKMVFRVSKAESVYHLGHDGAGSMLPKHRGRAFTDYGEVQIPYIEEKEQISLMEKYILSKKK